MKAIETVWDADSGILYTRLTGTVSVADVEGWRRGLEQAVAGLPDGTAFRLLVDVHGYEPGELAAHKAMRTVIPELLARAGMRPAYIDLFDERPEMTIRNERGLRCLAFANVHHDETKMDNYQRKIGRVDQRFFTDVAAARQWLARAGGD